MITKRDTQQTVADVHRRAAQLIFGPVTERPFTVGEIRRQLIAEFGRHLVEAAADDLRAAQPGTP